MRKCIPKTSNENDLKYYGPEEELTLQCRASDTVLGAALTQNDNPMA